MIRTLIVDDDPFVRMSLQTILEAQDDVEVCALGADGDEAVELFERERPDVLLMDIQMPEMDGYEATRVIRSLDRDDARSVPIVAMTANAFVEDEERSRMSGMDGHLSKPLDIHLVYATMDRFLRGRSRGGGA